MNRSVPFLLVLPAALLLALVFAGPLVVVAGLSFTGDARANYAPLVTADAARMIGVTILTAAGVATLSVGVGLPLALLIDASGRARRLALGLVAAPKLAGALATLLGLRVLLGRLDSPLLGSLAGSVLAESTLVVPYVVLLLVAQLGRADPLLVVAARTLGATRTQAFAWVTLPLVWPGLRLSFVLAFVWGLGAVFGPALFGGPRDTTLAAEVQRQAFDYAQPGRAAAVAVVLTAVAAGPLALWAWLARRRD